MAWRQDFGRLASVQLYNGTVVSNIGNTPNLSVKWIAEVLDVSDYL